MAVRSYHRNTALYRREGRAEGGQPVHRFVPELVLKLCSEIRGKQDEVVG